MRTWHLAIMLILDFASFNGILSVLLKADIPKPDLPQCELFVSLSGKV